jgi:hypothetical protein
MSDPEDEQETLQPEDPADDSSSESDDSADCARDVVKVWDGGKMIQTRDAEGNKIMKCSHGDCGGEWRNWNHTKALGHGLGKCGNTKQCKCVSQRWKKKYEAIRFGAVQRKQDKLDAVAQLNMGCDELEDRVRELQPGTASAAASTA